MMFYAVGKSGSKYSQSLLEHHSFVIANDGIKAGLAVN
jgi:hypothetical protein